MTLVGPGGIGKTRLSLQSATSVQDDYAQGVCFVPLTSVNDPGFIVSAIAETLKLLFHGSVDPKDQLFSYLRQKEMLLILDNFEHLLAGSELLAEITSIAPQVQLLVTSRERLNLQEEWGYEVQGMAYPETPDETVQIFDSYSAIQLFLQCAHRAKADFDPTDEDMPYLIRICQLVDGMPLGLELASTWLRMMSCQEITQEIAQNLDFLTTAMRNLPDRHRSLRAVFDHSWQLLSEQEQVIFRKLSIFQGGCTQDAAAQVAGASLPLLSALVDKSLLRRTRAGRYEIHELIRQFGAEKLSEIETEKERIETQHEQYYAAFLNQRAADFKSHRQKEALGEILAEIDNIRSSWHRAIAHQQLDAIRDSLDALWSFYEMQGWFHEGEQIFASAAESFAFVQMGQGLGSEDELKIAWGRALAYQGWFCWRLGQQKRSKQLMQESIPILQNIGEVARTTLAFTYYVLGLCDLGTGNKTTVTSSFQKSLSLYQEAGDRWGQGIVSVLLGKMIKDTGKLQEAAQLQQESANLLEELGDKRNMKFALGYLGSNYLYLGMYAQAERCLQKSYQISLTLDDQTGIAWGLIYLGHFAIWIGEHDKARSYLQESLNRCQEMGNQAGIARSLQELGTIYCRQNDFDKAEELYHDSSTILEEIGLTGLMAFCSDSLGLLACDRGDLSLAKQHWQDALTLHQESNRLFWIPQTLAKLGHVSWALDEKRAAQRFYQEALTTAHHMGTVPFVLDTLSGTALPLCKGNRTDQEQAAERLTFVCHHPAVGFETKTKASRLLSELASSLPTTVFASAKQRGQARELTSTVTEILDELSNLNWGILSQHRFKRPSQSGGCL